MVSNDLRRAEEAVMEAVMKWRKQHPDMERGLGYLGEIIEAADHLSALRASQAGKPLSCDGCATRDRIIENAEFLVRGGDRDYALKVLRGEVLLPAPTPPAEEAGTWERVVDVAGGEASKRLSVTPEEAKPKAGPCKCKRFDPCPSCAPSPRKLEKCDAVIGCGGKGVDGWGETCLRCGGEGVEPSCAPSTEKGGERK